MKKYVIKDEDNMSYEVTEVEEQDEDIPAQEGTPQNDEPTIQDFTEEEKGILRKLLPYADKLIALVAEEQPAEEDGIEDEDEDEFDEDEDEIDEEIVDTEAKDSINKSAASNKKKQKVNDSYDDLDDDVSKVWDGRFAQFKKGDTEI